METVETVKMSIFPHLKKKRMLKLAPELLSVFLSATVHISSVKVQLGRVHGQRVSKPVLKSACELGAVGEALVTQDVFPLGDLVLAFNVFLLDTHRWMVCTVHS